jgi:hypothetical protein
MSREGARVFFGGRVSDSAQPDRGRCVCEGWSDHVARKHPSPVIESTIECREMSGVLSETRTPDTRQLSGLSSPLRRRCPPTPLRQPNDAVMSDCAFSRPLPPSSTFLLPIEDRRDLYIDVFHMA